MASELQFPIVLRMKQRTVAIVLGIGVLLVVAGAFESMDEGTTRAPIFGRVPMQYVGWLSFALGLCIVLAALNGLLRGRPMVLIEADGVTVMANIGGGKHVAWSEVDRWRTYANRYTTGVEIRTSAGKKILVPAYEGTADDLYDTLKRAAKADTEKQKVPTSSAGPSEIT